MLSAISAFASCGASVPEKGPDEWGGLRYRILDEFDPYDCGGVYQIPGGMGGWRYVDDRYPLKTDEDGNSVVPDVCVLYTVTAWPDYSDGNKVITRIDVSDPGVSVFGVTIDTGEDEFISIMTEKGFAAESDCDLPVGVSWHVSAKSPDGSYSVVMTMLKNGEKRFYVTAPVSNREGIKF